MAKNFPYCKYCRDYKPLKNGQVHHIADTKCKFHMKHNHQPFEHYESEPKDHSNLYIGIALGVIITFCAAVYVFVSYMEAVMY